MQSRVSHHYAIAVGSNRRGRHGSPEREVAAALSALNPVSVSPIVVSAPLGPSIRRFANAVALIDSGEPPPILLARLKSLEQRFGRRSGQRWGARVIDLDIILWSGGFWRSSGLCVPHVAFRERRFVLDPLARIAADWRDPQTGRTVRQLAARARAVDRRPHRS
jgi:2-amino-4-hydroxy-6-hydroxymethyldihydropteridine diphosphokinase